MSHGSPPSQRPPSGGPLLARPIAAAAGAGTGAAGKRAQPAPSRPPPPPPPQRVRSPVSDASEVESVQSVCCTLFSCCIPYVTQLPCFCRLMNPYLDAVTAASTTLIILRHVLHQENEDLQCFVLLLFFAFPSLTPKSVFSLCSSNSRRMSPPHLRSSSDSCVMSFDERDLPRKNPCSHSCAAMTSASASSPLSARSGASVTSGTADSYDEDFEQLSEASSPSQGAPPKPRFAITKTAATSAPVKPVAGPSTARIVKPVQESLSIAVLLSHLHMFSLPLLVSDGDSSFAEESVTSQDEIPTSKSQSTAKQPTSSKHAGAEDSYTDDFESDANRSRLSSSIEKPVAPLSDDDDGSMALRKTRTHREVFVRCRPRSFRTSSMLLKREKQNKLNAGAASSKTCCGIETKFCAVIHHQERRIR